MDKKVIMDRLQENYELVESMGYEVVGIFLQGSQNYGLDYEGSDIDCKAIVLPKFNDFVLNRKEVSTTHVCENDEHVDIKDIRTMFGTIKKQNINFVEILFTEYRIMNPKYEAFFQPMFDNNEAIAHYNNYASINCMVGMVMEKYKALEHPYPATIEKINKFGYDGKQLHHILRIKEFMCRYALEIPYKECLISEIPRYLIEVKKNTHYNLEEARIKAKDTVELVKGLKEFYLKEFPLIVNEDVEVLMNDVLLNIIRQSFVSELKEIS